MTAGAAGAQFAAYRRQDDAADQNAAVRLWLQPRQLKVQPGDLFEVAVEVSAGRAISHLPFNLSFDPAMLAVAQVAPGDFLGDAGKAEILADYSHPGSVVVGASRLGDVPGVTGAGTLVRVTFRALAAGAAVVGIANPEALDSSLHQVLPISVQPAHIAVQGGGGGTAPHPAGPQPQAAPGPGKVPAAAGVGPSDG